MISEIVQDLYNLTLHEVTIYGANDEVYQIYPPANNLMYHSLRLIEGMFEASVSGELVIRDINSTSEQINFSGFETLVIKVENQNIPNSYKSLKFKIYNVQAGGNQIEGVRTDSKTNIPDIFLHIKFTSYEHYLLTHKELKEIAEPKEIGQDIIVPIATEKTPTQATVIGAAQALQQSLGTNGLVNLIEQKFFKTGKESGTTQKSMYIEPTSNWIWFKQKQLLYPWAKLNKPVRVAQLMQFLAEYAVTKENQYACNFLFWQDLDRWNFRSVESLLGEEIKAEYTILETQLASAKIFDLKIINESNFLRLFESNAISAKYYLVEPKWDNPYKDYIDYSESHEVKEITYDYFKDYYKWKKVEKYPIFDETVDTAPTNANVIQDNVSGYFEPSYSNRENKIEWEHYGNTYSNRDGSVTWQPMFDQTELDGETCRKIQKEIKQKLKEKKAEYAAKMNLKERWKIYRCSICCDDSYSDEEAGEPIFNPQYGVVAAGAFSDMVNYKLGVTGSTAMFPLGLTLSYEFSDYPYSQTIGDIMHLTDAPEIKTKYLYELELKRIDIAEELIQKAKTRYENALAKMESIPVCETPDFGNPYDYMLRYTFSSPGPDGTSQRILCWVKEEYKQKVIDGYKDKIGSIDLLIGSDYFSKMRDIINEENQKFLDTYEKYRNRKAFFISKEVGFTAGSRKNLVNVKSITRVPIRGSKYEKLAHKTVLKQLSGITTPIKGFTAGTTGYYPYDIFYGDDPTISPKDKHPYYDSAFNTDIGYNAHTAFSMFEDSGGPNAGSPILDTISGGRDLLTYGISVQIKEKITTSKRVVDFPPKFDDDGNYSGFDCDADPIIYDTPETSSQNFREYTNTSTNRDDLTFSSIINFFIETKRKEILQQFSSGDQEIEISNDTITVTTYSISDCPDRTDIDPPFTKKAYTYNIEKVYTSPDSQFGPGIILLSPLGGDRIDNFNIIEYINSRNFVEINEASIPTETVLGEIESFIRVEFKQPIGTNTLTDFPKGFYDTPGSEYYLPYHVLITPGPFGTKSVDYNVAVIGQDPYGFDVAVRRIRKKKQELKTDKKALVNNKDYHVQIQGYAPSDTIQNPWLNTDGGWWGRNWWVGGSSNWWGSELYSRFPVSYGNNLLMPNFEGSGEYSYFPHRLPNGTILGLFEANDDKNRKIKDLFGNFTFNGKNSTNPLNTNEWFYHDLVARITRKNPLSLPDSYFEFSNNRPSGVLLNVLNNESTTDQQFTGILSSYKEDFPENFNLYYNTWQNSNVSSDIPLIPSNLMIFVLRSDETIPLDVEYFKSAQVFEPQGNYPIYDLPYNYSYAELDIRDRNDREGNEPENEKTFFGFYKGVAIWKHPAVDGLDLTDEEIQKAVWKNDISGETEYGLVGPELEEDDSLFDRNFAAQFVVMSRQDIENSNSPCSKYPCGNPNPVSNFGCPEDDPLCNCPCKELRPDRMTLPENRELLGLGLTGGYYGLTGPEPTYAELKKLQNEIKECDLIENVLGEDWLGCVWTDPKHPLNCNCPFIGKKFTEYLRFSQTYCTFWNTPPERPLLRNAQMMQLNSNKIAIKLNGDLTLRPGMKVKLHLGEKRYSGDWLVSMIDHDLARTKHFMTVILIRDSEHIDHAVRKKKLDLNTKDK